MSNQQETLEFKIRSYKGRTIYKEKAKLNDNKKIRKVSDFLLMKFGINLKSSDKPEKYW